MKIRLEYKLANGEGVMKKYAKTFTNVNDSAGQKDLKLLVTNYLKLVDLAGQSVQYTIYKVVDNVVTSDTVQG